MAGTACWYKVVTKISNKIEHTVCIVRIIFDHIIMYVGGEGEGEWICFNVIVLHSLGYKFLLGALFPELFIANYW